MSLFTSSRLAQVFLVGMLLGLSGCSTEKLEKGILKNEKDISDLRKYQADQTTRISALEDQVRVLNGKLEELEFSQNKRLGSDISSLRQDLSSLRRKIPPPAIVPATALEADEISAERLPASIGQQYLEALSKVRTGDFSLAKSHFDELRALTEGTEQEVFMLFWLGVVYEGLSDDKAALEAYLMASGKYPAHSRTALCMLRQAGVLLRLRDMKSAQVTLKKLISDFPRSDEAMKAKTKLKDLK